MYGIVFENFDAEVCNSEISNCAAYCVYLSGGEHKFAHNTIASFFGASWMQSVSREDVAALYINDLNKSAAPTHSYFYNNIVTGIRENNLVLATALPKHYNGEFAGNYLRMDTTDNNFIFHDNRYYKEDDELFLNTEYKYKEYKYYDFHLADKSPAIGVALSSSALPADLLEDMSLLHYDRDSIKHPAENISAGCYERLSE